MANVHHSMPPSIRRQPSSLGADDAPPAKKAALSHTQGASLTLNKIQDPGQGFGVAVERVNPSQPSIDIALNVNEAVVNGDPAKNMTFLILCDVSGSMMPPNGTKPREYDGDCGAKSMGCMIKDLPRLLESKIPASQLQNAVFAIGVFASTAGWIGYDVRTMRAQGSGLSEAASTPPIGLIDGEGNELPHYTIENRNGVSDCKSRFKKFGTMAFDDMCQEIGDAILDFAFPGSTNFESAIHFGHQVLRQYEIDTFDFGFSNRNSHLIIATDGIPQVGMQFPRALRDLHEKISLNRFYGCRTNNGEGKDYNVFLRASINFVLMGNDTNPIWVQELCGANSVIGYCANSTPEQVEAGFMGAFGAILENHGSLIVKVSSDFRSKNEVLENPEASPSNAKVLFNCNQFNQITIHNLGVIRGSNYTTLFRHELPDWQMCELEEDSWRSKLPTEEIWDDAVLQLHVTLVLGDGCAIDLGKKHVGVLPHDSSYYWGSETRTTIKNSMNRGGRGFCTPIKASSKMKIPDAVYAYVEATLCAFRDATFTIMQSTSLQDSIDIAQTLSTKTQAAGLTRVSDRLRLHCERSRSQAGVSRETSVPHYCSAMLSQTPSSSNDF